MKKVLFVATVVKLHINAFHIPYLKMLKEMGWETAVAAHNDYDPPEACRIPYCDTFYDLPFSRSPFAKTNIKAYRELKKIINDGGYDVVHCHTPVGGVMARLAARQARRKGTKVFYTAHGFHFFSGAPLINWLLYYPVERALARLTDVIITINREDYERAKRFGAAQVSYMRGVGCNLARFSSADASKRALIRARLGIAEDAFVMLSVGELNRNKNHGLAIAALARMHEGKARLVICGEGAMRPEYEALARREGVAEQVTFAGYCENVEEYYQMADVFVFCSLREGLGMAVVEAMACGLPAVCVENRGTRDLILDGANGRLVPNDAQALSQALLQLEQSPQERMRFARQAHEDAQAFALESALESMRAIYRKNAP